MLINDRNLLASKNHDYSEMAVIFERVFNVIDHFEQYNHIEQIANLSNRVKTIRNELRHCKAVKVVLSRFFESA